MDISNQRHSVIEQFCYKIPVNFWKIHVGEVVTPWLSISFRLLKMKVIVRITPKTQ